MQSESEIYQSNGNANLQASKKDSCEHQLRPIYDLFESTATSATTKEDLIDAIRKAAGATTIWNKLWPIG